MSKVRVFLAFLVLAVPVTAAAQYRNLDAAVAGVGRGFERGDTQQLIAGVGTGEKIQLQFPGLVGESGFFGRDQASYLLDELFGKAKPSAYQQVSARRVSAEGQYHITARWSIKVDNRDEERDLFITLQSREEKWSLVSVRSSGQ